MFDQDIKLLPKKIWVSPEEEDIQREEPKPIKGLRTADGRLVIGFVEGGHESFDEQLTT